MNEKVRLVGICCRRLRLFTRDHENEQARDFLPLSLEMLSDSVEEVIKIDSRLLARLRADVEGLLTSHFPVQPSKISNATSND